MGNSQTTALKPAVKDPHNIEATKYYIFNETGNIMLSSTVDANQPIEASVQRIFAEVSVFFAGMTRAIQTTTNPATKKPYSIYNYTALERVIGGSGLFVHVTEEDVTYSTQSVGMSFSKELIEALLGLATGAGELAFAQAMIASMGQEGLRISESSSHTESKVANIVFVCEYLLGMPIVSAIVVYADCQKNKQQIQLGPCFKEESQTTKWILHKDTYLFVTPAFIHDYAGDLDSVNSDPNYIQLINWLQGLLQQTPQIFGVYDSENNAISSGSALDPSKSYKITGEFLPAPGGILKFVKSTENLTTGKTWGSDEIQFSIGGSVKQTKPAPIGIYASKNATTPILVTPGTYTVKDSK